MSNASKRKLDMKRPAKSLNLRNLGLSQQSEMHLQSQHPEIQKQNSFYVSIFFFFFVLQYLETIIQLGLFKTLFENNP
jgi:hypothetical protein